MEGAQLNSTIAALDIGTSKISVAVGEVGPSGELAVLGFGKVPAAGIHAGSVQDVELAVESIRAAVAEAEATSERKITTVSAALTGKHLHSINKVGRLVLPDGEVDANAVKRATRLAMAFDPKVDARSPDDRVVSHVIKGYTLDNDDAMLQDPIGMAGSVLKAHAHLAIGSDSVVVNLVKCIRRASLDIEGLVLQPWASAAGTLTQTEKELGVIALDIGAGTVDVACFEKGHIAFTGVAQTGGEIITRDIAAGLNCALADAEDIKLAYGHVGARPEDAYERIRYIRESTQTEEAITSSQLVNIIEARSEEILRMTAHYFLNSDHWLQKAAAGIVITGGVSRMPGLDRLAKAVLGLPVRVGVPPMQKGSALGLVSPEDSTVVGVLLETLRRRRVSGDNKHKAGRFDGFFGVVRRIMFGDFSG